MLNSKQRAYLRGLANTRQDTLQIGKEGVTEGVIRQLDTLLECHELVKIKLLESAMLTPRDVLETLCGTLRAEPVQCIGTKAVLYRQSTDPDRRKIVLAK